MLGPAGQTGGHNGSNGPEWWRLKSQGGLFSWWFQTGSGNNTWEAALNATHSQLGWVNQWISSSINAPRRCSWCHFLPLSFNGDDVNCFRSSCMVAGRPGGGSCLSVTVWPVQLKQDAGICPAEVFYSKMGKKALKELLDLDSGTCTSLALFVHMWLLLTFLLTYLLRRRDSRGLV